MGHVAIALPGVNILLFAASMGMASATENNRPASVSVNTAIRINDAMMGSHCFFIVSFLGMEFDGVYLN